MDEDPNNKTFDKIYYQTPQLKIKSMCMRKTKSTYNTLTLETDHSSTYKKQYNTNRRTLPHQNSVKQLHTINNSKIIKKTFDENNTIIKKKELNKRYSLRPDKINKNEKDINTNNNKKRISKTEERDDAKINIKKRLSEKKNKNTNENDLKNDKKENQEQKNIKCKKREKIKDNKNEKKEELKKNNNKEKNDDKNYSKTEINKKEGNSKQNIENKKENKIKNLKKDIKNKAYNTFNNKSNSEINSLEVNHLSPGKSISPKKFHNLSLDQKITGEKISPRRKKILPNGNKAQNEKEKEKENTNESKKKVEEKKITKLAKKDKEKINKNILISKKEEKEYKKNLNNTNNLNNLNSPKLTIKAKKHEFLYIPHIVLDPLDVLKNQIEIVLSQFDDKLKKLNKSTLEDSAQFLIKKAHEEYANKLQEIYDNQESELIKIKNIYSFKLYKVSINNDENEDEEENKKKYDELVEKKDNEINELEQKFIERKKKLKCEFKNKIEELKKTYDVEKQINLNKELVDEIKKKLVKIFNDKNMINKKGINFSLKDYKKCMKNNKLKQNNASDTSLKK